MKLRIIRKQYPGYDPFYCFQRKIFGIFWTTIVCGINKDVILDYAKKFNTNLNNCTKNEVIWVNPGIY